MVTPLDAGYSVLGWNHPGFWGSSVSTALALTRGSVTQHSSVVVIVALQLQGYVHTERYLFLFLVNFKNIILYNLPELFCIFFSISVNHVNDRLFCSVLFYSCP